MTDEVGGRGPCRSNSTSVGGGRNYYPQVDELVHANDEKLTEKLTKDWLLCLLRDTVSHLREAKSIFTYFSLAK